MAAFDWIVAGLYFGILAILSFYGLHRYIMTFLYYRNRHNAARLRERFEELPMVTVQIPSYNEIYVIERIIDAACALDYPRARLEIQVLDDSTDETRQIAAEAVGRRREQGIDIRYIHRSNRTGFKAGALENGLLTARGEFVAIFDADFVPRPDFLQRTIHYFTDARVGVVQARWEHLNREYSLLTRAQGIFLDGHFMMESNTRFLSGRFFNFNGTAGILRRAAIDDAGGWEHDTLTEDLDLSYRAQLRGWKFIFLPDLSVPAELPVEMNAFKEQQCRWAKGAMQTCRKSLGRILRSRLTRGQKLEAFFHLTGNVSYPLMVLLSLSLFPALIVRYNQGWFELLILDLPLFILAFSSVSCFYITSQRLLHADWYRKVLFLPVLMSVGIGMCVAGAKAVLEGAAGIRSPFVRTPKFSVQGNDREWKSKKYRGRTGLVPMLEIALGLYSTWMVVYTWNLGVYGILPFLFLFQFGFFYVGFSSLTQRFRRLRLPELLSRRFSLSDKEEAVKA
ncbi:MAG: glycosyltransferase [Acidobacteria bacterium]|nr:glycosyltransferase [Acidobacteriota bacterium]